MPDVEVSDLFKTVSSAGTAEDVGTCLQKGDGVLFQGYKAERTANAGNVWIKFKAGNGVARKIEPEDEIYFAGPNGEELALDQFQVHVEAANDGVGVQLLKHAPYD